MKKQKINNNNNNNNDKRKIMNSATSEKITKLYHQKM